MASDTIDISLPARHHQLGKKHPLSQVTDELRSIFKRLGFVERFGPEIESDYYNFTALNLGELHPARAMHDSFYLAYPEAHLLRTHTSSVQIRAMEKAKPPLKIFTIGKAYRADSDATHTPMFHQIEVFYIDTSYEPTLHY